MDYRGVDGDALSAVAGIRADMVAVHRCPLATCLCPPFDEHEPAGRRKTEEKRERERGAMHAGTVGERHPLEPLPCSYLQRRKNPG